MSNVATIPSLKMQEQELIGVLRESLYPGAEDNSIRMVLGYCRAAGLDPMQKPVHIVPMWDSKASRMRDVVMPGVGLYRTQAARSGEYGGISDPEFGPEITENIGGYEITYPEYCRITVSRIVCDRLVTFSAVERWKENYAMKGGKERSIAPNTMWAKRPYGQLAKCAEAQALRKAFPEVGSAPTADEMEGKSFVDNEVERPQARPEKEIYSDVAFEKNYPKWAEIVAAGKKSPEDILATVESKAVLSDEQRTAILNIGKENAQ
ncbi:phage recombination protein Bet [uncultured Alcanivorax sp.]|uniref:phage recombination protein Bet n=1 Tax=uncultured Alcanivorax sp. TaxID=191215 RepID=UPI0032B1119E